MNRVADNVWSKIFTQRYFSELDNSLFSKFLFIVGRDTGDLANAKYTV